MKEWSGEGGGGRDHEKEKAVVEGGGGSGRGWGGGGRGLVIDLNVVFKYILIRICLQQQLLCPLINFCKAF